jgi:ankyrin repeat protein
LNREWEAAAKLGDASALAAQLAAGAEADALDRFGQSALMLAARGGHLEAVQVLIDARADLDVTAKFGLSATMLAVVNHHVAVARALAAAGANLALLGSGAPGFFGKSAVDLARERNLHDLVADLETMSVSIT